MLNLDKYDISKSSWSTLDDNEWLNDEAMDFGFRYLYDVVISENFSDPISKILGLTSIPNYTYHGSGCDVESDVDPANSSTYNNRKSDNLSEQPSKRLKICLLNNTSLYYYTIEDDLDELLSSWKDIVNDLVFTIDVFPGDKTIQTISESNTKENISNSLKDEVFISERESVKRKRTSENHSSDDIYLNNKIKNIHNQNTTSTPSPLYPQIHVKPYLPKEDENSVSKNSESTPIMYIVPVNSGQESGCNHWTSLLSFFYSNFDCENNPPSLSSSDVSKSLKQCSCDKSNSLKQCSCDKSNSLKQCSSNNHNFLKYPGFFTHHHLDSIWSNPLKSDSEKILLQAQKYTSNSTNSVVSSDVSNHHLSSPFVLPTLPLTEAQLQAAKTASRVSLFESYLNGVDNLETLTSEFDSDVDNGTNTSGDHFVKDMELSAFLSLNSVKKKTDNTNTDTNINLIVNEENETQLGTRSQNEGISLMESTCNGDLATDNDILLYGSTSSSNSLFNSLSHSSHFDFFNHSNFTQYPNLVQSIKFKDTTMDNSILCKPPQRDFFKIWPVDIQKNSFDCGVYMLVVSYLTVYYAILQFTKDNNNNRFYDDHLVYNVRSHLLSFPNPDNTIKAVRLYLYSILKKKFMDSF